MCWIMILLITATIPLILFLSFYFWARYKQTYWSQRGVYSPPSHWFYGHVYESIKKKCTISRHLTDICMDPSNQNMPVIGVYIFHKPYLLLCDRSLIKRMLIEDFCHFTDRRFSINCQNDVVENANLFAIKNPQWRYLRTKLERAFGKNRQRALCRLMLERAENLRCHLKKKVPSNELVQVHVRSFARRFMTDVTISLMFGLSTNSFAEPDTEIYKHVCGMYKTIRSNVSLMYMKVLFPKLVNRLFGTPLSQHVDFFRNLFWKSMNEREISGARNNDFIDLLLELKNSDENETFKFDGDWLFAQAMILTVAGLETSAFVMSFTLLEMARNPQIQKRVREEIRHHIGPKDITLKLISKMSYLESVVAETLRKYPPTSFLNRVAQRDYKIANSNIVIEKGTVVYISLRELHQNPLYHPRPVAFDPNRFNKKNRTKIRRCTYMPFGDGPRMCIGNRIALMQIMIGLIVVMSNYKISWKVSRCDIERTTRTSDDALSLFFKRSS